MEFLSDPIQAMIVAFLVPIIVWGIKLVSIKFGYEMPRMVVSLVILVISAIICFIVKPPMFPADMSDPALYGQQLLVGLSAYFGAIKVVYDFILSHVFKAMESK